MQLVRGLIGEGVGRFPLPCYHKGGVGTPVYATLYFKYLSFQFYTRKLGYFTFTNSILFLYVILYTQPPFVKAPPDLPLIYDCIYSLGFCQK